MDIGLLRTASDSFRKYLDALLLCNSVSARDWAAAQQRFDSLGPFLVFKDDPDLIRRFRGGEEAARRELGRRGTILEALQVFYRGYSGAKWEQARRTLLESGTGGPELLVTVLLTLLLDVQFNDLWMHIRYNLVQAGPLALADAAELARRIADASPVTPVFKLEDLTQLIVLLIEFGARGRPHVERLAAHDNHNVRRSVAKAIGEAVDEAGAPLLARLLAVDPEWTVRGTAAEACGRLGPSRSLLGPALVARLGAEREPFVLRSVLRSIGEIHYEEAVPDLVRMMEATSLQTAEAAMYALYRITAEKFILREQWRKWHAESYPVWRIRDPNAVPELMKMLDLPPDAAPAEAAMYALHRITGEKFTRRELWRKWYADAYPEWKTRQSPPRR